ncbi:MAG: hypothetical protein FWD98_05655, partial [Defluviitaleaceae bacterium]|nr:hypothetical protein [Defluviitaleaceae bacterium]
ANAANPQWFASLTLTTYGGKSTENTSEWGFQTRPKRVPPAHSIPANRKGSRRRHFLASAQKSCGSLGSYLLTDTQSRSVSVA